MNTGIRTRIEQDGTDFFAILDWREDPPPPPLTKDNPVYHGTSTRLGPFPSRADAQNAAGVKVAELVDPAIVVVNAEDRNYINVSVNDLPAPLDSDSVTVRRDDLEVLIMFAIASFKNTTRLPSAVTRLQEALTR